MAQLRMSDGILKQLKVHHPDVCIGCDNPKRSRLVAHTWCSGNVRSTVEILRDTDETGRTRTRGMVIKECLDKECPNIVRDIPVKDALKVILDKIRP